MLKVYSDYAFRQTMPLLLQRSQVSEYQYDCQLMDSW